MNNPFLLVVAILQFFGAIWYFIKSKPMFGLLLLLYSLANVVMVLMKGE